MDNPDPPFAVFYRLTPGDVTEATRLHQTRTAPGRFGVALVLLLFIWFSWELFFLATLPRREDAAGQIGQCAFILLLIAIYCADQRFLLPRRAHQTWCRVDNLTAETSLTWNESGLNIKTESSRLKLSWTGIWRRLDSTNLMLLYQSANEFVIIPKRAFAAPLLAGFEQNLVAVLRKELLF